MYIDIIGGGYAGCAAALHLLKHGKCRIRIWEQRPVLGGRARRITLPHQNPNDPILDNGQHLIAGAYHTLLELIKLAHAPASAPIETHPLTLIYAGQLTPWLALPNYPAPFNFLLGLFRLKWPLAERLQAVKLLIRLKQPSFQKKYPTIQTLKNLHPKLYEALLEPLCLGILNTPANIACTARFSAILALLFKKQSDSHAIFAQTDLSTLFPEAVAKKLIEANHTIHYKTKVLTIEQQSNQKWLLNTSQGSVESDAIIIASAPNHTSKILDKLTHLPEVAAFSTWIKTLRYAPITTIYFQCAQLPKFSYPMLQLDNNPAQWIFERTLHSEDETLKTYALVISTAEHWLTLPHENRINTIQKQLSKAFNVKILTIENLHVITEKQATYCIVPQLCYPSKTALADRLYVAGDYLDSTLPATLETAVKSGVHSATQCLQALDAEARLSS